MGEEDNIDQDDIEKKPLRTLLRPATDNRECLDSNK